MHRCSYAEFHPGRDGVFSHILSGFIEKIGTLLFHLLVYTPLMIRTLFLLSTLERFYHGRVKVPFASFVDVKMNLFT